MCIHVHVHVLYQCTHLGICGYFEMVVAKVTFHSELEYWSGIILAHFTLVRIVPHPHTCVGATPTTPNIERELKPVIKMK